MEKTGLMGSSVPVETREMPQPQGVITGLPGIQQAAFASSVALRIEHKFGKTEGAPPALVVINHEGVNAWKFEGPSPNQQVDQLLEAVAEWCRSVMGVEVVFEPQRR